MYHDARVGQGVSLARLASCEEQRAHGTRLAHAVGVHGRADVLHLGLHTRYETGGLAQRDLGWSVRCRIWPFPL